jgi:tetratricopeptide (TPR) repeat protein
MIGTFHPDTYFGKRLGGFTKRMEKIFQRLTEAHDVLSNSHGRQEYERYLVALGRTRGLDDEAPSSVEDLEQLLMQAEQAIKKREAAHAEELARAQPPPRHALQPPPLPQRKQSQRPVEMVDDPVARRQALARKFGLVGSTSPSTPPEAESPPEDMRSQRARSFAAVKDFHQRYQHRKHAIREQRVERFAAAAEEALATGNTVSALNTLKIARTLSGGDIMTVARLAELEKQVGATVVDSYLERARYEETNGHFEEAARSYTRAARGKPSSDVFRSAAECYLKAGVELRLASDLAREAVKIAPNRADLRVTLAKVYEAAGMTQSAIGELERALELTPDSDRIKQWLKRIKRGGV